MLPYPANEVYVGELDPNVNEEMLFGAFSKIGRIHSLKVMRHIVTGASRGFAFINFFSYGEACRAQKIMDREKFFGRQIRVYLKSEYDNLDPNASVVIQGLSEGTTEAEILGLLTSIANPFSIKIAKNEKKPEEVKVFVQFAAMDAAVKTIERLNGQTHKDREMVAELTNKKNRVFIKAKYHENAMAELKASLSEWKFEESETPELSSDKTSFIVLLKFESEASAQRFLDEYRRDPKKCRLTRPHHPQRRRQAEPPHPQGRLRQREPDHLLQDHPLPRPGSVRPVQGGGRAAVRADHRLQGELTRSRTSGRTATRSRSASRAPRASASSSWPSRRRTKS